MKDNNPKFIEKITKKDIALIEAALYVSGRPLGLTELTKTLGAKSKEKVQKAAEHLVGLYKTYKSAIEVLEIKEQRFVLQLKPEYTKRVRKLSLQSMLTKGPLRTLSFIAYYQPVLQTKVIDSRGNHAYTHIKLLEEQRLIERQGAGRTKIIRTTTFFADYFGLSHNLGALKRQIKRMFNPK
jgi:segregation and condensation protein B